MLFTIQLKYIQLFTTLNGKHTHNFSYMCYVQWTTHKIHCMPLLNWAFGPPACMETHFQYSFVGKPTRRSMPGVWKPDVCVAFLCHNVTYPPGGLLSFTCLHHPHLHSSVGMHREESAVSSIFELDEGRWGRGPSQVWLLWKVLQACQGYSWPRI